MFIKDIKRIKNDSFEILSINDIENYIEYPLIKAHEEFFCKNIKTVMSSSNKRNVLWLDDDNNSLDYTWYGDNFNFGKGYAWIMLDYDLLSDSNKDIIGKLCDDDLVILAVHPDTNSYISKLQALNHNPYKDDPRYVDFYSKCLCINTTKYCERSVVLRYPVDENTLDSSVEEYFLSLSKVFKKQDKMIDGNRSILNSYLKKYNVLLERYGYNIDSLNILNPDFASDIACLIFIISTLEINNNFDSYKSISNVNIHMGIGDNPVAIEFYYESKKRIISLDNNDYGNETIYFGTTNDLEKLNKERKLLSDFSSFYSSRYCNELVTNIDVKNKRILKDTFN